MILYENKAINFPAGFYANGVVCGLKKNGSPDLALVFSKEPAQFAGIYTSNIVKGHSLQRTIEIEKKQSSSHGVLINSGNANACVGPAGYHSACEMAAAIANQTHVNPDDILTCSTGVIGQPLQMNRILPRIEELVAGLSDSEESGHLATEAIMTTDLVSKEASSVFCIDSQKVKLSGIAKGSGMIHPNLATMISVLTTDAAIDAELLKKSLKKAANVSFNRITVDGDTSVCDTLLIFANGQSHTHEIKENTPEYQIFLSALIDVCTKLAKSMAKDGEGATKLVDVQVTGAATPDDAYKILLAVCRSPLCKTAFFGEDANWGRILTAAGYSGAAFDPEKASIYISDLIVYDKGVGLSFDEERASAIMAKPEFSILIALGDGNANDHMWTCDFSYDYVKINGSYRS